MRKIVRLTESDLVKLVKKVLQEQTQPDPKKIVTDCFMSTLSLQDVSKVPQSCIVIGMEVMTSKKIPGPEKFPSVMQCGMELVRVAAEDPFGVSQKVMEVVNCILGKSKNPVAY